MNLAAVIILFGLIGILFYELFVRLRLMGDIQQMFNVAPAAVRVIRSTTLSDEEKEKSVRHMSLVVLKDTFMFTAKLACILLACVALAAITQLMFRPSPDGLSALLASWQGLVAAVVVVALYARLKPVIRPSRSPSSTRHYSMLDRLLHRLAFIHPGLQRTLGDVENDLFSKQLAEVELTRPVFVTGLPRAGTTLLLELLYDTGLFASFTYRHMPFVLNPLLWDRLSARSRNKGELQERAHGDGMLVSFDSPEAFEEVLWINHLGKAISDGQAMRPLEPADLTDAFREAFVNLASKLVCLKGSDMPVSSTGSPRYLSKNNANLSRLAAIRSVFPDADLLLCYRHPSTHVASLHNQHLRFLDMHRDDPFAQHYMRMIGHHDFGANFRAIRFSREITLDPKEPMFWLQYWIDAYRHVLEYAPERTQFLGYESMLDNGAANLKHLAGRLGLDDLSAEALTTSAARLRQPGSRGVPLSDLSVDLAVEAEAIYDQLQARSSAQGYAGSRHPEALVPTTPCGTE